jgi:AraC-like DNA-binding protein
VAGRSLRQVERRIKQWARLPLRGLRGFGRAEQAFFRGMSDASGTRKPHWAALAESSGFADQSHLCRVTRRITGFTPDALYRRIAEDEGFWSYRLWQ